MPFSPSVPVQRLRLPAKAQSGKKPDQNKPNFFITGLTIKEEKELKEKLQDHTWV